MRSFTNHRAWRKAFSGSGGPTSCTAARTLYEVLCICQPCVVSEVDLWRARRKRFIGSRPIEDGEQEVKWIRLTPQLILFVPKYPSTQLHSLNNTIDHHYTHAALLYRLADTASFSTRLTDMMPSERIFDNGDDILKKEQPPKLLLLRTFHGTFHGTFLAGLIPASSNHIILQL
ncbi:hypothetical protein SODALDRAFT_363801 [Sodiomyces alkalinus F11]|uniref:Uncharacterized protein n=1 Tax=Sodiomyces alkalinus (strain CBS 110278 / VKM F-3762 / F11) TaxID=1314773 RepID=A0A3N2PKR0_SODAK|nr:hypothetical protein SODALDRAFT_363801 [Sodiomyces alkalinus F11]ROT35112.1 hypothetical protein SODALDRAFT_363801 [Sodiomyces alkalinus F11]